MTRIFAGEDYAVVTNDFALLLGYPSDSRKADAKDLTLIAVRRSVPRVEISSSGLLYGVLRAAIVIGLRKAKPIHAALEGCASAVKAGTHRAQRAISSPPVRRT